MWVYPGAPQPKPIGATKLLTAKVTGNVHGLFRRDTGSGVKESVQESQGPPPTSPNFREEIKQATVRLAKELERTGIDFVRCWFQWNFFEPNIGERPYKFPLDDFVSILNSEGVEIVAVLENGYSRFLPRGMDENNSEDYLTKLADVSTAVVHHYKDSIKTWQIENEPNWWFAHLASSWREGRIWNKPGMKDAVLGTLSEIVREENPSSTVIINLEADRERTDSKSFVKYCDVVGLDFYPNYARATPIDVSKFKFSSKVKSETGLPVFIAETGYPSGPPREGYSEVNQAAYVARACEEAYSSDFLNGIALWRYSDSYWTSFPEKENHFGLRTKEGKPKLGWIEYGNQIRKSRSGQSQESRMPGQISSP